MILHSNFSNVEQFLARKTVLHVQSSQLSSIKKIAGYGANKLLCRLLLYTILTFRTGSGESNIFLVNGCHKAFSNDELNTTNPLVLNSR